MREKTIKRCCICGKLFYGYGHCSEPVKKGVCCYHCKHDIVIPRLMKLFKIIKRGYV